MTIKTLRTKNSAEKNHIEKINYKKILKSKENEDFCLMLSSSYNMGVKNSNGGCKRKEPCFYNKKR